MLRRRPGGTGGLAAGGGGGRERGVSVVGFESDDGGAVVREVRPRLHLDRLVLLYGLLQGADGEGGVQAGVEILGPHASILGVGRGDALLAAAARLHQRRIHLQDVRE